MFIYVYNNHYAAFHLSQVDNMNNESTKVLHAVCVLKNITWSREKLSVMEFDALMAMMLSKMLLSSTGAHGMVILIHSVDSYFTETNTFHISAIIIAAIIFVQRSACLLQYSKRSECSTHHVQRIQSSAV